MKRVLKTIVTVVSLVALSVPSFAQDTLKLTLQDALEIALSENLTVKVADMEIQRTEYAKKGTYASLFPQIDFSANYQASIKKQTMYMGDQSFQIGRDHTWTTGFSLGMPLVSVPLWKSLKITGMDVELSVEKARASRQDLVDQIKQTFYTSLLAADSYEVYKENYQNTLEDLEDVKEKYENGKAAKFDLIRAEVNVQNAIPMMYDAKNSVALTQWKLKALMGVDLNLEIECVGNLADYKDELAAVDVKSSIDLSKNSTMKQLGIQKDMLQKSYEIALAKYYPSLNFSMNYQWMAMENNMKFSNYIWSPYSTAAVSLAIPIFSGGQRFHSVKQTRVQQRQLDLQIENAQRELEVGIRQALSSMYTCKEQHEAAAKSIEGAEAGYSIAQKRYEIGSGTLLELNDAQLALLQARLNFNQSIYNYLVAKSALDKLLGADVPGVN